MTAGNSPSNPSISEVFWNFVFSCGLFRADLLQFFTKKRLTLTISSKAKNLPSNPRISGIFLKYPNFLWNVLELTFFKFLPKKPQDLAIGLLAGNSISNQPFQEFCWNFLFSCGMIRSWFLALFYQETSRYAIGWTGKNLPSNPSVSGIFLRFPSFLWNVLGLIFFNSLRINI